jgi:hypothetical protein
MSKTLWHTIKLEVPKEMVNITKNDKVVVKKSLTKTNNISKANKEPSIKIIPGDTNKPKIISDGKEWNIEELKLKMKKSKELGKKNEGKEYKKEMTKDKAAKIITNEINSRAKLNRADKYLKKKKEIEDITENKKYTLDQLKNVTRRILQIRFSRDMSGVDMDSYTRETMQDIIKDFLQKRPSYIEYINKIIKEEPKEKEFKRKQNKK